MHMYMWQEDQTSARSNRVVGKMVQGDHGHVKRKIGSLVNIITLSSDDLQDYLSIVFNKAIMKVRKIRGSRKPLTPSLATKIEKQEPISLGGLHSPTQWEDYIEPSTLQKLQDILHKQLHILPEKLLVRLPQQIEGNVVPKVLFKIRLCTGQCEYVPIFSPSQLILVHNNANNSCENNCAIVYLGVPSMPYHRLA